MSVARCTIILDASIIMTSVHVSGNCCLNDQVITLNILVLARTARTDDNSPSQSPYSNI